MDWQFSATTNGFYPADSLEDYPNLPTDLVDITADQYGALQLAQSRDGMRIVSDENGFPVAVAKLPPTLAELRQTRDGLLQLAALRIGPLQDAVDLGAATADEQVQLLGWKKYRMALNRLDLALTPVAWPGQPD